MWSFVGLIALIMITLSAMNGRSRDENSQGRADVSPDTLTFEVRREERNLKEGEFIVPVSEDDGIRGQSPRTAPAGQDRQLFTSREKERGRANTVDETIFPRRRSTPGNAEGFSLDSGRTSGDSNSFDDEVVVPARRGNGVDRLPPAVAPLAGDDEWGREPVVPEVSGRGRRNQRGLGDVVTQVDDTPVPIDRREPERRSPAIKPVRPRNSSIEPVADTRQPIHSNRNERTSSIRQTDLTELDESLIESLDRATAVDRRAPNPRGRQPAGANFDSFNDDDLDSPIDLRRRREPSNSRADDYEPAKSDVAPARIDRRFLDVVKDNTIGIRRDEAEVYYWLLDHARRVPSAALERAAEKEVQYINLMTEPDHFRGEPITIEGDLWRLYEFDAGENQYGVTKIYEGWVFTGDSSNHPYRIVCTSLPNGIELGENLRKPVRITGYFFKREGYRSNGGVHVAPTLLARRISINPMPNGIPLTAGVLPYMIGAIMAIGLSLLVTIVGFAISDGRSAREGMERVRRRPQVSFSGLVVPESVSVEELLRQLAEREQESAINGAYGPLFSRKDSQEHAVHDYATSRKIIADADGRLHRHQTDTVQNWSARQKAAQSEIDALRAAQTRPDTHLDPADDEIASDDFDPVQRILVKPNPTGPTPSIAFSTNHQQAKPPSNAVRGFAPTSAMNSMATSAATSPAKTEPEVSPNVRPAAKPANRVHNESKLSEWEEEIAQMSPPTVDGVVRHADVREDLDDDRVAFDRSDRDSTLYSLADPNSSVVDSAKSNEEIASNDSKNENESEAGSRRGRFRKRRNR